jgi:Modifier of rudimentary (Mod(r)) protein
LSIFYIGIIINGPIFFLFLLSSLKLQKLIDRLRVAAEEADMAAATLESNFRSGALPLDRFIDEYTALRTKYHARDMKYQAALQTIPNALAGGGGGGGGGASPPMQ